MKPRAFKQVDVFTATPYRGNPLVVVLDGAGLDTATMQHFTNWTNLSECAFLLPPTPEGAAAAIAASALGASCRSPGTRRWAVAMRGWRPGACRVVRSWCRNAAWDWFGFDRPMTGWHSLPRPSSKAGRSAMPMWR